MKITAQLPSGVSALFFESAARRRALEEQMVGSLESAGFSEVLMPILDYLEPYEPLLSATSRGELYRFIDRAGEQLALRSDFTAMLARLIAPRLDGLELPLHLFYRGDVVRFEADSNGSRERELYQLGAEMLGSPGESSEATDGQALELFLHLLEGARPGGLQVVVGFAGALDGLLAQAGEGAGSLAEAIARRERGAARQAGEAVLDVVESGVPRDPEQLGGARGARLTALLEMVERLRSQFPAIRLTVDLAEFARFTLDPSLSQVESRRGYYDGIAFRAYVPGRALAVGGGGRYDRLFARLGAPVPAVGFSIGLDRLAGAMEEGS